MPGYIVERTFPEGLRIPANEQGAQACLAVIGNNSQSNVTRLISYVSRDFSKTLRVYDGPNPESIREAASINNLLSIVSPKSACLTRISIGHDHGSVHRPIGRH